MNQSRILIFTDFAERYGLTPEQAVYVPALMERASAPYIFSPEAFCRHVLHHEPKAGEYLAEVCRESAASE